MPVDVACPASALIETLETAEYPLLIHCAWGSERTGLVSAFAELLRPGGTLDDARAQFSIRYLFVRINDGKVMAEHLDQYETWLRNERPSNTTRPIFTDGSTRDSSPGGPSREEWPYDPYPLVVVTRPGSSRPSRPDRRTATLGRRSGNDRH